MKAHNVRALEAARRVVAGLPGALGGLVPTFVHATGTDPERVCLADLARDGAFHAVCVIAGEGGLQVMTRSYGRRTLTGGMVVESLASSATSARHDPFTREGAEAFGSALSGALVAAPDSFEPIRRPGCGVDGPTALMEVVARAAVRALEADDPSRGPVRVTLNDPPPAKGRDVLRFVGVDGEPLPLALRVGRHYAVEAFDPGSGEVLARWDDLSGYRAIQPEMDALLAERAPSASPKP